MQVRSLGKAKLSRGLSTLEVLIAAAILALALTAIITVIFGNQSLATDTQTNNEAIAKAQELLEKAYANSRKDFNLLNPSDTNDTSGPVSYDEKLDVTLLPDLFTKQATSTITWQSGGRTLSVVLSSLFTNPDAVHGGDTCSSVLEGDWTHPQISTPIAVEDPSNSASGNPVTDIDVFDHKLYITTDNEHGHNADFYIFDSTSDPKYPTYVTSVQTVTKHAGLNAVAISSSPSAVYAYVASAYGADFSTCTADVNCSQLQIIDVTNPSTGISVVRNVKIPSASSPHVTGNSGQAVGKSIYYKNGILYLGLTKTASGPEFITLDVGGGGAGGSPTAPVYLGSYPVGHTVNAISVRNGLAYLATDDQTNDLLVLDVSSPSSPSFEGYFNASGIGYGSAENIVGDTLYLGTTYAGNTTPEFYAVNVGSSNKNPYPSTYTWNIGTAADTESVSGILVRDYLAFVLTTNYFEIKNLSTDTIVKTFDLPSIVGPGSGGFASDCEGNYLYVGSYRNNNDKGVILSVYPGP